MPGSECTSPRSTATTFLNSCLMRLANLFQYLLVPFLNWQNLSPPHWAVLYINAILAITVNSSKTNDLLPNTRQIFSKPLNIRYGHQQPSVCLSERKVISLSKFCNLFPKLAEQQNWPPCLPHTHYTLFTTWRRMFLGMQEAFPC